MKTKLSDQLIADILHKKDVSKRSFVEISAFIEKTYGQVIDELEVKDIYNKYKNSFEGNLALPKLKELARAKKTNSITSKENRTILQLWNDRDDILDAIKAAAREIGKMKVPTLKQKKNSKKKGITKELLLSDIHFGKVTESFNLEILKKRLKQVVEATVGEIERDSKEYNIDEIIVGLLGDIIENYSMHSLESAKGCEFGNAKQIYEALINIFKIVIVPLNQLGYKIRVVCVTGNHDRDGTHRTYHHPGEENFTYIIYNALKDLSETAGLKNISFTIPKDPWAIIEVYGNKVLYEHYDNAKSADRKGLEALMTKRANQLNIVIDYMRGGHFHEPTSFRNGRIQINGCLTGNDSFASVLGYNSEASQTLNTFVNSSRRYKMYKSFNILLE
jgi:predicted MPP superfamily phosphohydrolase